MEFNIVYPGKKAVGGGKTCQEKKQSTELDSEVIPDTRVISEQLKFL